MSHTLLLTTKEVARELQISEKTVSRMVQKGQIPSLRIGRTIRIPTEQLKDWIREQSGYTSTRVGRAAQYPKGESEWPINAKTVRSGGHRSSMQMGKELDALLERRKRRKR